MRVLLLHNGSRAPWPSGEQAVLDAECRALRAQGATVSVLTAVECGWSCRRWTQANIFWSRAAFRETRQRIGSFQPDVVHVHGVLPHFTVAVFDACRAERVPVLQTLHNYRWLCVEGGLFRAQSICRDCLEINRWQGARWACARNSHVASALLAGNNAWWVGGRRLFHKVDRFLAVSEFVRDVHLQAGFPAELLHVKYNGVEISATAARWSDLPQPVVTFVGRLDRAKGTATLAELPSLLPQVHWNIVGQGPDGARLQQALSANPQVRFWGPLPPPEVRQLIGRSRVVVVPSLVPESFGLVAAEALGCGVPVVGSRLGGLAELLTRSGGGAAVDPQGGAAAFAPALRRLLEDRAQWQAAAEQGRRFAEAELSLAHTARQLLGIYGDLIASRPAPRT